MHLYLWHLKALLLLYSTAWVYGEIYIECENPAVFNTFVASLRDCANYVYCNGVESFEGECLDDNYFDEQKSQCDSRELVLCKLVGEALTTVNDMDDMDDMDDTSDTTAIADRNDPNAAYNSTVMMETVTASVNSSSSNDFATEVVTDVVTTVSFTYGQENSSAINITTSAYDGRCPVVPGARDILLRLSDETSCSAYYTCYQGVAVRMLCNPQLYFNAQSGRCEPRDRVLCALSWPVLQECKRGIYDFMPHPQNCDYYYYCADGFRLIFQCPFNFAWHFERRVCLQRSLAKCFSSSILRLMLAI